MTRKNWVINGTSIDTEDIFCIIIYAYNGRQFYFDVSSNTQEELQELEADLNVLKLNDSFIGKYGKRRVSISEVSAYEIEYE